MITEIDFKVTGEERKKLAYAIGETLGLGENESSKYQLSVLNSLKNRGVQDILILCSDGLTGIKDAISTAFS